MLLASVPKPVVAWTASSLIIGVIDEPSLPGSALDPGVELLSGCSGCVGVVVSPPGLLGCIGVVVARPGLFGSVGVVVPPPGLLGSVGVVVPPPGLLGCVGVVVPPPGLLGCIGVGMTPVFDGLIGVDADFSDHLTCSTLF